MTQLFAAEPRRRGSALAGMILSARNFDPRAKTATAPAPIPAIFRNPRRSIVLPFAGPEPSVSCSAMCLPLMAFLHA